MLLIHKHILRLDIDLYLNMAEEKKEVVRLVTSI